MKETGVPAVRFPSTSKDAGRPNKSHSITMSGECEDDMSKPIDIQEEWPI